LGNLAPRVKAMGVFFVYAGLLTVAIGIASILKPLPSLRIPTRPTGGFVLALGVAVGLAGAALPAPVHRSATSLLMDRFMPVYHFNEVHSIRIRATPDRIFRAIRAVTPAEIRWSRTLFWIRSLPARLAGKTARGLSGEPKPLLEPAPGRGTVILGEEPNQELLLGIVGPFWKPAGGRPPRIEGARDFLVFEDPDHAKATMSFWLEDVGEGSFRLTTETRVFTPDPATRRKFAAYWRLIYPGSALLRQTFLAAIKRRAEAEPLSP
jgi:hypothetical protein